MGYLVLHLLDNTDLDLVLTLQVRVQVSPGLVSPVLESLELVSQVTEHSLFDKDQSLQFPM